MALAYWAAGHPAEANEYLGYARDTFGPQGTQVWTSAFLTFSCWRYRRVPDSEFLEDLDEIEALINGDASRKPRFMTAAKRSSD